MNQKLAINQGKQLPNIFTYQNKLKLFNLKQVLSLQKEISNFQIVSKESTQICFLVDATGSMQKHVDQVRQKINQICKSIQNSQKEETKIYVSMVAYRDRNDAKQTEKIDFTNNLDEFKSFVGQLEFQGGGDECEDVIAGFKEVISLSWKENSLNLMIWIADSPCHGKQFHEENIRDDFLQDSEEDVKILLKKICDLNVDFYFFKITKWTDKMIKIFQQQVHDNDRIMKQRQLKQNNFSNIVLKSYFGSMSYSAYGEFFKYVSHLEKTKQIENCLRLKGKIKEYQQLVNLQQEYLDSQETQTNFAVQVKDIQNMKDIKCNEAEEFTVYKFNLNENINIIELEYKKTMKLRVSFEIIGQGAFKETYLAQDMKSSNMYALKKFKESNSFDFDNLLMEYYIQLIAEKINEDFYESLQKNIEPSQNQELEDLKIYFDDQFIIQNKSTKQFYMMELAKNGFKKYINTDQNIKQQLKQELIRTVLKLLTLFF
ncbi:hypothetical protein ABPG74_006856 [Tetrahymena malaccensis]